MNRKNISRKIEKQLLLSSMNLCCFKGCKTKLYDIETKSIVGEICHINAVNSNGARFDDTLSEDYINSLDNLIMLCGVHHKIIDDNPTEFTVPILKKLKEDHEKKYSNLSEMNGLESISEEDLDIEKLLTKINEYFTKKEEVALCEKITYKNSPHYLERKLISNQFGDIGNEYSLNDLIKKEKRIVIVATPGAGKSIELDHLAYLHSNTDSELFPIKLPLKLFNGEDLSQYLEKNYKDFKKIPSDQLLVLLDALDEVEIDRTVTAANSIALFANQFKDATVVVSCRKNLYNSAEIRDFVPFQIKPLTYNDIRVYTTEILQNSEKVSDFISKVKKIGIFDVLGTPFDLVYLTNYYKDKGNIPNSRVALFEYLIEEKNKIDSKKFNINIQFYETKVQEAIEKVAFAIQCLGRNYLKTKEEYLKIVSTVELFDITKRTFLVSKTDTEDWSFEHKSFQEYLAAKYLEKLTYRQIRNLVSFNKFKKINPNWLNTLSNLLGILDAKSDKFNLLFNWIKSIEPDVLVRFEKDKIDPTKRELIFRDLYSYSRNKEIWIRSEKFNTIDLGSFVSDIDAVLKKLIEDIGNIDNHQVLVDSALLLKHFDNVGNYKQKIGEAIFPKINNPNYKVITKYYLLHALANLGISDEDNSDKILSNNNFSGKKHIRAGFYNYILNSDHLEKYIEYYLEGITHVIHSENSVSGSSDDEDNINLFDEADTLERVLDKIEDEKNIKLLLNYCQNLEDHSSFSFKTIRILLPKVQKLYLQGKVDLLDGVVELILNYSRKYFKDALKEIKLFVDNTGTSFTVFEMMYKKLKSGRTLGYELIEAISSIADTKIIHFIIDEVKGGKIDKSELHIIRNVLNSNRNQEAHDEFYKFLLSEFGDTYKYIDFNFEEKQKERELNDRKLLQDQSTFLKTIENFFKEHSKDEFTSNDLHDIKLDHYKTLDNDIIINTLTQWANDNAFVNYDYCTERIGKEFNWIWFKLHKLVSKDTNSKDFEFNAAEKEFIENWVKENIGGVDFATAIKYEGENYKYRYTEPYIVYFSQRLGIEMTKDIYLDFLFIDCDIVPFKRVNEDEKKNDRLISDFVMSKTSLDLVVERICNNLRTHVISKRIKNSYFQFFRKHSVKEGVEFLSKEITDCTYSGYDKRSLVTTYLKLGGKLDLLEELLENNIKDLHDFLIDQLIEYESGMIEQFCLNMYNSAEKKSDKLLYIEYLLKIDSASHLHYLRDWIIANHELPDIYLPLVKNVNYKDLVIIYEDCLKRNYGTNHWKVTRDSFLNLIIELSSKDARLHKETKKKLKFWVRSFNDCNFLYYHMDKLDNLYYSQIQQSLTFSDVENIFSDPMIDSRVVSFYDKYKKEIWNTLAIISLVVTIIGTVKSFM